MTSGIVFDVKRYSLHDGPGIRTTIFLQGCPLSCWWCHNPESQRRGSAVHYAPEHCLGCAACVDACDEGALTRAPGGIRRDEARCRQCGECARACPGEARVLVGRTMTVDEVLVEVEKDRLFYDESGGGVTFSGGEPLGQKEFLLALLGECGKRELHRTVDTCGLAARESLLRVAAETDLFLFDLKMMDPARHRETTGVSNELILDNLCLLAARGHRIHVRVPVIPGINDDKGNLDATAAFLRALPGVRTVGLLPFHASARRKHAKFGVPWRLNGAEEISTERLEAIAARLTRFDLHVDIGD